LPASPRWTAPSNDIIVTRAIGGSDTPAGPRGEKNIGSRGRRPRRATLRAMNYSISTEDGFLRAELLERETADETRTFLQAVVLATVNHRCSRVLVHVRLSKPLFTIERHGVLR